MDWLMIASSLIRGLQADQLATEMRGTPFKKKISVNQTNQHILSILLEEKTVHATALSKDDDKRQLTSTANEAEWCG